MESLGGRRGDKPPMGPPKHPGKPASVSYITRRELDMCGISNLHIDWSTLNWWHILRRTMTEPRESAATLHSSRLACCVVQEGPRAGNVAQPRHGLQVQAGNGSGALHRHAVVGCRRTPSSREHRDVNGVHSKPTTHPTGTESTAEAPDPWCELLVWSDTKNQRIGKYRKAWVKTAHLPGWRRGQIPGWSLGGNATYTLDKGNTKKNRKKFANKQKESRWHINIFSSSPR